MGCGSTKEKIENEMIAMKLERVGIQMERRNQIKLLEEMDGRKIKEPTIPDYSVLSPKEKNIENKKNIFPAKSKLGNKETENRGRSKSVDVKKKIKSIKTNSTTGLESKKNIKGNKTLKKISK